MTGTLYLCGTPIGNLEDMTLRALRILKEADGIACEDTRHTLKLLNHYGIQKPLVSYHQHDLERGEARILAWLGEGKTVVMVSDAGLPCISDPGARLVPLAREGGHRVSVLPGASASLSALMLSGQDTARFAFEGFLPRSKRKERLQELVRDPRTLIFYEAPHRLKAVLSDMAEVFGGERSISLVREITKIHEETFVTNLGEAAKHFKTQEPRGEYVLVVAGAAETVAEGPWQELLRQYLADMPAMDAVKAVARERGIKKSEVYQESLRLRGRA